MHTSAEEKTISSAAHTYFPRWWFHQLIANPPAHEYNKNLPHARTHSGLHSFPQRPNHLSLSLRCIRVYLAITRVGIKEEILWKKASSAHLREKEKNKRFRTSSRSNGSCVWNWMYTYIYLRRYICTTASLSLSFSAGSVRRGAAHTTLTWGGQHFLPASQPLDSHLRGRRSAADSYR